MTDDRARRIAAIERLVTCYPRFSLTKATINAYADHLADTDPDELAVVLERLAKFATFFPSIAEIRQAMFPQYTEPAPLKRTGWRFVRGTHGSTYVHDKDGTDQPPTWMQ